MIKRLGFATIFAAAALVGQAQAGNISVTATQSASSAPGHSLYTVNVASDTGAINGVDISFNGQMNQVNPFGLETIFQNNNGAIIGSGADPSEDSQFLFQSNQVLSLDTAEGSDFLRGALTNLAGFDGGVGIDIAQIVVPDGGTIAFSGAVDDGSGDAIAIEGVFPLVVLDPILAGTPPSGSDLSAALQAAFDARTSDVVTVENAIMVMNDNGEFSELGVITPDVLDNLPGIDVGLNPGTGEGKFDLVMSGDFSALDPGTMIMGDIVITASGAPDQQLNYTFSAKVPEPSTVALAGLALVGLVGYTRRRAA